MKPNRIKTAMIGAIAFVVLFNLDCYSQETKQTSDIKTQAVFPKGALGPDENFTLKGGLKIPPPANLVG